MTTATISAHVPQTRARPVLTSTRRRWAGRILTAVPVLFLLADGVSKPIVIRPVVEAMAHLGYPIGAARGLGVLLLTCLALYVWPRTAPLGAVLLTGCLGGAIATHVRVNDPLFSNVLFPVYMGLLLWGGLYLRDGRLGIMNPLRSAARGWVVHASRWSTHVPTRRRRREVVMPETPRMALPEKPPQDELAVAWRPRPSAPRRARLQTQGFVLS